MNQPQFPSEEFTNLASQSMQHTSGGPRLGKTNFYLAYLMQQHLNEMHSRAKEIPAVKPVRQAIRPTFRELLEKELAKRGIRR